LSSSGIQGRLKFFLTKFISQRATRTWRGAV
jgi:hypothetical protein